MTKYIANNGTPITANGTYYIADVNKKRDLVQWFGTFFGYGTFGGGTIAWEISPDGGTTKLPLLDASGNAITSTTNDNFTSNLAGGADNFDAPKLYAIVTGATSPSINVILFDNNG